MQITVNGEPTNVRVSVLTYEDVSLLANMMDRPGLTVTYAGPGRRAGTLRPGHSIDIEDGMVFDATWTGAA